MTAQAITARLRALARQAAGRTVYRPTKPVALFVCDRAPEQLSDDWQVFSRNGQVYYTPSVALMTREGLLPAVSEVPPMPSEWDEDAFVLYTCAVRCLRETENESDPELIVLCLYHLSFGEKKALARSLPGMMARRLRNRQPLSRAAGAIIMEHLFPDILTGGNENADHTHGAQ